MRLLTSFVWLEMSVLSPVNVVFLTQRMCEGSGEWPPGRLKMCLCEKKIQISPNPHETFDDTMDMKLECMIEPDASQFPPVHPGGMKHCEEMLAAAAVTDVQGATANQSRFPTF